MSLANLPIGYFTFLRIAVTVGAILCVLKEIKFGINIWVILFGCITILFNPIIPIYLYQKSIWAPLDVITAIVFLVYSFKNKN